MKQLDEQTAAAIQRLARALAVRVNDLVTGRAFETKNSLWEIHAIEAGWTPPAEPKASP